MSTRFFALLYLFLIGSLGYAQQVSGIFQASDAQWEYIENQEWEAFQADYQRLSAEGYRLTDVQTTGKGNARRFWGIMTESALTDTLVKVNSWTEMVKAKRAMAAAGYLLSNVQAYAINETDAHYIGIWYRDPESTPHKIWKLDSPTSLRERTDDMAQQKYYLQEVEVFLTPSGTANYLAIYHYSLIPVRNYVFVQTDEDTFIKDLWQRQQSDIRLVDYERFSAKEAAYILGVYQPGTYASQYVFNQRRDDFNAKWEQLEKENLKLVAWEVRE